jgi:NADH-quinone oxidoreductase subunit E
VECLGACGFAPVMIVDDEYHEDLDPKKVDAILSDLDKRDKESGRG